MLSPLGDLWEEEMKEWLKLLLHVHLWVIKEEGERTEHGRRVGLIKFCECSVCGKWKAFKL